MQDFNNNAVAGFSALITATVGFLVWFTGWRQKGLDQQVAKETSNHDQIQEDLAACRIEAERQRKRADEYQDRFDKSEMARVEALRNYRDDMASDQNKRHELRSLVRALLIRIEDHNHDCKQCEISIDDLKVRVEMLDRAR